MRAVHGYVSIGEFYYHGDGHPPVNLIFGRNIGGGKISKLIENFETNGLVTFRDLDAVRKASFDVHKIRDCRHAYSYEISMKIAEQEDEMRSLIKMQSLVVLWYDMEDKTRKKVHLCGPAVEGRSTFACHIPGAFYVENGLIPWIEDKELGSAYERALHQLLEINRQAQSAATLAHILLSKV